MGHFYDGGKFLNMLKEQSFEYDLHEHEEVFTVDQMMPLVSHLPGVHCKNLFLRDKKKSGFWLLSARHDAPVNLNIISKSLSISGGLRLADETQLYEKIGVKQGCVTPYALLNDCKSEVKFIVDSKIWEGDEEERIYFHPLTNSATLGMSRRDFKKLITQIGHDPQTVVLG